MLNHNIFPLLQESELCMEVSFGTQIEQIYED